MNRRPNIWTQEFQFEFSDLQFVFKVYIVKVEYNTQYFMYSIYSFRKILLTCHRYYTQLTETCRHAVSFT